MAMLPYYADSSGVARGAKGLEHPLGSGALLVKCPNSCFFPLGSWDGPREMLKFKMSIPFGPAGAYPGGRGSVERPNVCIVSL